MISTAYALAVNEMVVLSRSHLEIVIDLDIEFDSRKQRHKHHRQFILLT